EAGEGGFDAGGDFVDQRAALGRGEARVGELAEGDERAHAIPLRGRDVVDLEGAVEERSQAAGGEVGDEAVVGEGVESRRRGGGLRGGDRGQKDFREEASHGERYSFHLIKFQSSIVSATSRTPSSC